MRMNPYIKHWEAARYDADQFVATDAANREKRMARVHHHHRTRRRRDTADSGIRDSEEVGSDKDEQEDHDDGMELSKVVGAIPQEPVRLNFSAHDR